VAAICLDHDIGMDARLKAGPQRDGQRGHIAAQPGVPLSQCGVNDDVRLQLGVDFHLRVNHDRQTPVLPCLADLRERRDPNRGYPLNGRFAVDDRLCKRYGSPDSQGLLDFKDDHPEPAAVQTACNSGPEVTTSPQSNYFPFHWMRLPSLISFRMRSGMLYRLFQCDSRRSAR